jgi:WXXGXW repeat (2 copies)
MDASDTAGRMTMQRLRLAVLLLFALMPMILPVTSRAQIISITIAPPELPIYEQPPIPSPGYMWSPGYWAYDPDNGYFWVPGTWVQPPDVGLLWTPGYWGWRDGIYAWNAGYWGPHIGFYGGVNYGFGYGGAGYEGGYWNNGVFAYNRTVNNFGGVTITNVYEKTVIVNNTGAARASFNGGSGGTTAQPTAQEQAVAHEQHIAATPAQAQQQQTASTNKALFASNNHGQPAVAATAKPGEFTGNGVVAAKPVTPGANALGTKPAGAAAVGKDSTVPSSQAIKPKSQPAVAKLPNANPTGTTPNSATPPGSGKSEKRETPNDQAKLNTGNPSKPSNRGAKPLATTPPPKAATPNLAPRPPAPATAAVKPPSPPPRPTAPTQAAVKPPSPAAKPGCPPGKRMTPAGCK